jgi:hypothetical protein
LGDERLVAFRGDDAGEHGALRGHRHLSAPNATRLEGGRELRPHAGFELRERLRRGDQIRRRTKLHANRRGRVLLVAPATAGFALIVEILNRVAAEQTGIGLAELRLERVLDFARVAADEITLAALPSGAASELIAPAEAALLPAKTALLAEAALAKSAGLLCEPAAGIAEGA